jgi:hypothetical protein
MGLKIPLFAHSTPPVITNPRAKKKARHRCRTLNKYLLRVELTPAPMTGNPIFTPVLTAPMTRSPDPARMRRHSPVTPDGDISPVPCFPLLVDPNVTRTWSNSPDYRMPYRTNRNINLRRSGVSERTRTDHQNSQKCQFYKLTFHMLVFKFTDWTSKSAES